MDNSHGNDNNDKNDNTDNVNSNEDNNDNNSVLRRRRVTLAKRMWTENLSLII